MEAVILFGLIMDVVVFILFLLAVLVFLVTTILFWVGNGGPLIKVLRYSTIVILILAVLIIIYAAISGDLFTDIGKKPYF